MNAADYYSAESTLQRMLTIQEKTAADSLGMAIVLHNLGVCYTELGRGAEAETALRRSLAITEKILGSNNIEAANTRHCLGSLYGLVGRFSEAEYFLRSALATKEKLLGSRDRSVAQTLAELGDLEFARGRFLSARSVLSRALEIATTPGVQDARLAGILARLGLVYLSLGELENAERACVRASGICERLNGPYHVATAQVLITLANIARLKRRHDEADALLARAREGFARTFGPSTRGGFILMFQAENEAEIGRFSLAEHLYKQSLAQLELDLGSENYKVGLALSTFANLYTRQKKYAEAEPLLRRALAISEKALGPQHPTVGNQLAAYAALLRRLKRKSEAEQFEARAQSIRAIATLSKHRGDVGELRRQ
jgi:tetratricopeptide (TPR) repeat protein